MYIFVSKHFKYITMSVEPTNDEMENLSPEELAQKKQEMLEFYEESMPYLQAQLAYEKILSEIDEVRFRRSQIQMQFAMMMNPPEDEQNNNPEPSKKRTLKKK